MAQAKINAPAAKSAGKKAGKKAMTEAEKKTREEMLAKETDAERFVRVGTPRLNKAIKSVLQLRTLGGGKYESTPEQQKKIVDSLTNAINAVRDAFAGKKAGATLVQL